MKKRSKHKKLSRTSNQRQQLFKNLLRSLAMGGAIETSEAKATVIRPMAERLVTVGKDGTLTAFRQLTAKTGTVEVAKKYIELGKLFKDRKGGYLRRIRMHTQTGDDTSVIRLEWVEKLLVPEIVKPAHGSVTKPETKKVIKSSTDLNIPVAERGTALKEATKPKKTIAKKK